MIGKVRYMHIRNYLLGFVVIILLVSTVVPVFSGSEENDSDSSLAPFEEFYEPDEKTERPIYGDVYGHTFNYTYNMDYDIVPENLVMFLDGTCTSWHRYIITVNRPDDREIRILNKEMDRDDHIKDIHSIRHSMKTRENIYDSMSYILRREEEDWNDPGVGNMANPTEVLFGEIDEDVLVDPEPLKGEYEIIVRIDGEDIEMNFGEDETKLSILSKPASEPRNLEGEYEEGKVRLEWDEPEEEGGSEIMQYNVYRSTALYGYEYIGNVSADQTEYVDDFEEEGPYLAPEGDIIYSEGDILYYTVVAINTGDYYYLVDSPRKRNYHFRRESMSVEEIVHLPYEETERSDMSYKWVMDYSSLSEDNFEDRGNMDSVNINRMEGGDVFLYDINRAGEENGQIVFEYEGGFYSKGEVDMVLEDDNATSELNIDMKESWFDFSGEIWAEEISNSGYEGLTIVKQTIESEGQVNAKLDNIFEFTFDENETYWEVSEELDIEWKIDLTLDYEGNNSWVLSRENATTMRTISRSDRFNYSGSVDAEGSLYQQSNHLDDEKKTEGEISKEISGTHDIFSGVLAHGRAEAFSPLVGAGSIGYYLALDQGLNASMGNLESDQDPFRLAFFTNCQRDEFSTEKLYGYQYMDPMALPGIGSFLGTELKRAYLTNYQQYIESLVRGITREWLMEAEDVENPSEWMENKTDDALEIILLENPWGIQQYNGIYRRDLYFYSALVIEPLGYFASEPLSEDELESYNENREKFFDNQLDREEDDEWLIPGYTSMVLLVGIISSLIIYKKSEKIGLKF